MEITTKEIQKYNLSRDLLGAKVTWARTKKGGLFICPECRLTLKKWDGPTGDIPTCPRCSKKNSEPVKGVLKYRVPTSEVKAVLTTMDGVSYRTTLHRHKGDRKNTEVQMQIMLGRLNKAYMLGVSEYPRAQQPDAGTPILVAFTLTN